MQFNSIFMPLITSRRRRVRACGSLKPRLEILFTRPLEIFPIIYLLSCHSKRVLCMQSTLHTQTSLLGSILSTAVYLWLDGWGWGKWNEVKLSSHKSVLIEVEDLQEITSVSALRAKPSLSLLILLLHTWLRKYSFVSTSRSWCVLLRISNEGGGEEGSS